MEKLLVILGPTASGKTSFAVKLADRFHGEIISADSRQIYKGMDIGTGKDLYEYKLKNKIIPYHLIDILDPKIDYSVFQFKNDFHKIYKVITDNNKLPILCGGTALYIDSILFNYDMSKSAPNPEIRNKLELLTIEKLKEELINRDKSLYDENFHTTKRRIIRSLEISDPKNNTINKSIDKSINNPLIIGMDVDRKLILNKIKVRLLERLNNGMIEEVQNLINEGLDIKSCTACMLISSSGTEREFIQRRGRMLRQLGTDKIAHLYDFVAYPPREIGGNAWTAKQLEADDTTISWILRHELARSDIIWEAADPLGAITQAETHMGQRFGNFGKTLRQIRSSMTS